MALRKNTTVALSTLCEASRISTPIPANKNADKVSSDKPINTDWRGGASADKVSDHSSEKAAMITNLLRGIGKRCFKGFDAFFFEFDQFIRVLFLLL